MKLHLVVLFLLVMISCSGQYFHRRTNAPADNPSFTKDLYIKPSEPVLRRSAAFKKAIKVPLLLTVASFYTMTDNENFSRAEVKEERDEWIPYFHHKADNYLQFAPIVAVYGLNLAGVKGKHDLRNRAALLFKSELLVAAITFPLKKITAVPRPDTGMRNSFPSGHTAQAFAAATFMSKEYGHLSIWYSVGAYAMAAGVGTMRIMNNRHWVSDVMAGAAVGILSTNLVYLTHRYKVGGKQNRLQTLVMPSYNGQVGMVTFVRTLG